MSEFCYIVERRCFFSSVMCHIPVLQTFLITPWLMSASSAAPQEESVSQWHMFELRINFAFSTLHNCSAGNHKNTVHVIFTDAGFHWPELANCLLTQLLHALLFTIDTSICWNLRLI